MKTFVLPFKYWLNEQLNESFVSIDKKEDEEDDDSVKDILMYTLSKDNKYEQYFKTKTLKFANNAGNMYGLGIYAGLEMPNENDSVYKDDTRKKLYGSNIYELSISSDRLFYFYYDYFKESSLYKMLGKPDFYSFIKKQFEYFGIKMPDAATLASMQPEKTDYEKAFNDTKSSGNQGQCAFNFYKYMNSVYYQRRDGTLDSPVAGIVYLGKMDGRVGVIWNPYELTIRRKQINGRWEDVDMPEPETEETVEDSNEETEIFDGNKTEEKEKIYRKLVAYKGEKTPLGQFVKIDIHDDKTIDAEFKANVPEMDGGRHALLIAPNKYIKDVVDKDYVLDNIDCWIKFGNSPSSAPEQLWLPSKADEKYIPKNISGGVILTSIDKELRAEIEALNSLDFHSNGELVLNNCYISSLDFCGWKVVEMNCCKISNEVYEELKSRKDVNIKGKHGQMTSMSLEMEDELVKYVKDNKVMPKADKEKFAEKFNMSLKDFEKAYSNSDTVKKARKNK